MMFHDHVSLIVCIVVSICKCWVYDELMLRKDVIAVIILGGKDGAK